MSAFLPQRDPNHPGRELGLQTARQLYAFSYTHVSPLAILDRVPFKDEFSLNWLAKMGERVLVTLSNRADLEAHQALKDFHTVTRGIISRVLADAATAVRGLKRLVADTLRFEGRLGAEPTDAAKLDDYAQLFRTIGLPPIAKNYQDDRQFARMRVAGPNPVMLRRFAARDARFPVTDADFQAAAPTDSFDAALAEGRLFLADYAPLDGVEPGSYPHGQKYIYAPLALFVLDKVTKGLRPVAIQCKQQPGPNNPIFTPADGYNWLIAKTVVEIADGTLHETFTHLGRTHLYMEPFAVSAHRQLAPNHPLALLLLPHFEGTAAINEAAWRNLVANKGAVDKLCGASIAASRGLAATAVQTAEVAQMLLPRTFEARGVADPAALPDYPYRDDALLYWAAIREWVAGYLALYYLSPTDVENDNELQAWCRELAANDGGRLAGMPNDGGFRTVEEVADVVAVVLFTCSVQHAAVNFPQYDLMSYAPNMPLAGYRPAPTVKAGSTEADYLAMLPPLDMAELQMELGYLLGSLHYSQLGLYPEGQFADPRVLPLLTRFQQALADIGRTIATRNTMRQPYTFLVPTGVPQSINV